MGMKGKTATRSVPADMNSLKALRFRGVCHWTGRWNTVDLPLAIFKMYRKVCAQSL